MSSRKADENSDNSDPFVNNAEVTITAHWIGDCSFKPLGFRGIRNCRS